MADPRIGGRDWELGRPLQYMVALACTHMTTMSHPCTFTQYARLSLSPRVFSALRPRKAKKLLCARACEPRTACRLHTSPCVSWGGDVANGARMCAMLRVPLSRLATLAARQPPVPCSGPEPCVDSSCSRRVSSFHRRTPNGRRPTCPYLLRNVNDIVTQSSVLSEITDIRCPLLFELRAFYTRLQLN